MSRFTPTSRRAITPRFLQELCHAVLQIPVPLITPGLQTEVCEESRSDTGSWLQDTFFPRHETWLDIPIHNLNIDGFKVRAASGLGIAFPGLWTTLSLGFSGSRLQGRSGDAIGLNDTTLYFSCPEIEHNAVPGSQSHWPPEMSAEPFQAIEAWVKRGADAPELIAIGLEGQGLLFVA